MTNFSDAVDAMGIKPAKIDKRGPMYRLSDVNKFALKLINSEYYFYRRVKMISDDFTNAIEKTVVMSKSFDDAIESFIKTETRLTEKTKSSAGALRECAERIGQGVARIEKTADFDRLERYVSLLERAESAMRSLGEMEQSGKLAKIAGALK